MNSKVKTLQFAIGVDLLGSKLTLTASKTVSLEATTVGIVCYSKTSNRTIVIPYSNIKGFELYPEDPTPVDPNAVPKGKRSQ